MISIRIIPDEYDPDMVDWYKLKDDGEIEYKMCTTHIDCFSLEQIRYIKEQFKLDVELY